MIKKTIIAIMIILIAAIGFLLWPRYEEPTLNPHMYTYEDAVDFALSIDNNATVSEVSKDETVDGHVYRTWPAVIYDKECRVAAVPEEVLSVSPIIFLSGLYKKDFYRLDTDYDYIMISEALKEHPELGELITGEFSDVVISRVTTDKMSDEKFKELEVSYDEVLSKVPLTKSFTVQVLAGDTEMHLMPKM